MAIPAKSRQAQSIAQPSRGGIGGLLVRITTVRTSRGQTAFVSRRRGRCIACQVRFDQDEGCRIGHCAYLVQVSARVGRNRETTTNTGSPPCCDQGAQVRILSAHRKWPRAPVRRVADRAISSWAQSGVCPWACGYGSAPTGRGLGCDSGCRGGRDWAVASWVWRQGSRPVCADVRGTRPGALLRSVLVRWRRR